MSDDTDCHTDEWVHTDDVAYLVIVDDEGHPFGRIEVSPWGVSLEFEAFDTTYTGGEPTNRVMHEAMAGVCELARKVLAAIEPGRTP